MGREIKRVPLNFDQPIGEIWWGYCPEVPDGLSEEEEENFYEAWVSIDPPEGPGYQLWETTTEGSPASPVFQTAGELARWMTENPCMFAGSMMSSFEAGMRFIEAGWSPSMVSSPERGLESGAEYVGREQ